MFPRLFLIIITVLIFFSCVTEPGSDKPEAADQPAASAVPAENEDAPERRNESKPAEAVTEAEPEEAAPADDFRAEAELRLLESLQDAEPERLTDISVSELPSLPDFPEITETTLSDTGAGQEEPSPAASADDDNRPVPAASTYRRKSFMENIFSGSRAEGDYPEPEPQAAEPESNKDAEPVQSAEAAPVIEPEPVAEAEPEAEPEPEPEPATAADDIKVAEREFFTISLDMQGWLLQEITVEGNGEGKPPRYSGREYLDDGTVFTFYPFGKGRFRIVFRRTDSSAGTVYREIYDVEVVAAEEIAEAEAVSEKTEEKSRGTESSLSEKVTVPAASEAAEPELTGNELSELAGRYVRMGKCGEAARLLRSGIGGTAWNERDVIYFMLAELYRDCSEIRDERRAVEYYGMIVDLYPVSEYWERAKQKKAYLERTYIHIR